MSGPAAATILIMIATERVSGPLKGIFQSLRYLDRTRYRPILCLLRARRAEPSDAELEACRYGIAVELLEQSGAFDWRLMGRARRLILEHGTALVQTHGYKTHLLGLYLKRSIGVRWVGFEHGWTAETWRVRLYHRLDWLLRYADRVIAVSDELRLQLRSMGVPESRLLRIHNAVERDEGWATCAPGLFRQAQGIPPDAPLVTVLGRITREKGQRVFLEAFQHVMMQFPQAHAAIVGEGVDEPNVRAIARTLGLGQAVHFVEWQRPVAPVYVDSDAIVIPSLGFEGIPNVMLEAMAAGTPVVATTVGGAEEIATDEAHALLVPPASPEAMAKAIARLLGDKALRDRLVEDARRQIESKHSPAGRAARIAEVYDSVLGR
jgi:glycosyltransferase involved in cell wall biosynthesis